MANKILNTYESITKPTFTGTSLANGAGRIATATDNTSIRAQRGFVAVQIKTGGSAPTAGAPIKVYLVRHSNDGTTNMIDDSQSATDAAASVEPVQAECLGAIIVTNATATTYRKVFPMRDLTAKFSILVWNACGQALSSTSSDFEIQVILVTDEVQ